ncbi:hypothetical protein JJQ90_26675 [Roseomonas sp. ROY-5-3]|uniref:Uncharacterized protein n=1 Tax=Falsiroseomonas oleicola TaxID=2801474 RepID=A0ABS6HEX8_9PROT|nr:hypothetical protein [Roseomonas oleicola]
MGGGTSLVESSRFGAETVGYDLNPVAWFVTKKQMEAGEASLEELEEGFQIGSWIARQRYTAQ